MSIVRFVLAVVGGSAFVYAMIALWALPWIDFGVSTAICAACVIGLELRLVVERDRERIRKDREAVWQRRIDNPDWLFCDLKPWPVDDDEPR